MHRDYLFEKCVCKQFRARFFLCGKCLGDSIAGQPASGRAGGIRTRGLFVPNEALYQAEPQPESGKNSHYALIEVKGKKIRRSLWNAGLSIQGRRFF
jgi:hypothetical protein